MNPDQDFASSHPRRSRPAVAAGSAVRWTRLALVWVLLLGACANPTPSRHADAAALEFAAKGYSAVGQDAVDTTVQVWRWDGEVVTLVVARPARGAVAPVVLYLPGLGEPSDAGEHWRSAWAVAGYAVVSVQALEEDALAWRSELAREGEFRTLGRQRYAVPAMRQRVRRLAELVAEAQRRGAAGDPAWQQLDWTRLAVAGFDLGAYTAMTLAGERSSEGAGEPDDLPRLPGIRAAIAFSPYASPAAGGLDTRWRDIHVPTLTVTSDVDVDPLGLVETVALRHAPFDRMPGPDNVLLDLHGLPHAALGGSGNAGAAQQASARGDGDAVTPPDSGQRQRGSKGQRSSSSGSSDGVRVASDRPARGPGGESLSPSALQMRRVAVQDLSTAFLDAFVKGDRRARDWLAVDASRWLGAAAELRRK